VSAGDETQGEGGQRKRRRGRRGGRRGRRGRGGEDRPAAETSGEDRAAVATHRGESVNGDASAAEMEAPALAPVNGTSEPVATTPVDDDWSPAAPVAMPEPVPAVIQKDEAPASAPEPQERAPERPQPAAEEAPAETESADDTVPKRSGWWQRRTSFF
jgi:ribonuclease E